MKRFKRILYVGEASVDQASAIARAVSLAKNNQADLKVMDVVPPLPEGGRLPSAGNWQSAMVDERRQALESLVAPHRQGVNVHLEVQVGKTFLEVIRTVLRDAHDLVIKPAENPGWVERLFGSDDMHLLRKCPCPVWMTKPGEKANYGCIMAALDFDPSQLDAVAQGLNGEILALAGSLALSDFAALHLVHAWNAPAEGILRARSSNPDADLFAYIEGERLRHQEGMDLLSQSLRERIGQEAYTYLSPQCHMAQGSPKTVVPGLATHLQADLVVMGTVGRTGISGLFMGNTSEAVLDQLKCSVLAIKPPGFVSPVMLDG